MFVYMYSELGKGGVWVYKNNVLMCLMFAVQLCEPYVKSFVWERVLGVRKHATTPQLCAWVLILMDMNVQAHAILYAVYSLL